MKKILLITGLFFLSIMQLNGQDWKSKQDSIRYAVAYEYILRDSVMMDEEIILSGEIIGTDFSIYDKILEPYIRKENESDEDYRLKLSSINKNSLELNTTTKFQYPIDKKNGKTVGVLSFSRIVDGFLFASVYFAASVPPFGYSYDYCFIFDLDNSIKKVFKGESYGL